uniref:Uncharacterized protein n=1 Tax=Macrostomum lignano TaxID=282301 RepID=A0A1I8IYW2_9PLAT
MDSGYQDTVCSSPNQPTAAAPASAHSGASIRRSCPRICGRGQPGTKQRRRSSSVGDLSKRIGEIRAAVAANCRSTCRPRTVPLLLISQWESQRARAVTVEQCGPAQNTNFPSSGLASPDTLSEYRYRPREALEFFHNKKRPFLLKLFASQSKRLLQQQQQKTSDSMMSATAYISPAVSTDFSHEMLAWYDSHRQRVASTASSSDCYCCSCCCCDSSAAAASSAGADRTELTAFL